jgi:N-acetylmuramoyl-L-alanine amidase
MFHYQLESAMTKLGVVTTIFILVAGLWSSGFSQNEKPLPILIDASHGGKDPGATDRNVQEKDLSLRYSKSLAMRLEKQNIRVLISREGDESVFLNDRMLKVNTSKVGALISIHFNRSQNKEQKGFDTFFKAGSQGSALLDSLIHKNIALLDSVDDQGGRTARLVVLKNSHAPAVVIHVGYMSNTENLTQLLNEAFQERIVDAIAHPITEYASRI